MSDAPERMTDLYDPHQFSVEVPLLDGLATATIDGMTVKSRETLEVSGLVTIHTNALQSYITGSPAEMIVLATEICRVLNTRFQVLCTYCRAEAERCQCEHFNQASQRIHEPRSQPEGT